MQTDDLFPQLDSAALRTLRAWDSEIPGDNWPASPVPTIAAGIARSGDAGVVRPRRRRQSDFDFLRLRLNLQRRAITEQALRIDQAQRDADLALEAQTELESRIADLEALVLQLVVRPAEEYIWRCARCTFERRSSELSSLRCPICDVSLTLRCSAES